MNISQQCYECRNYLGDRACLAFEVIPEDILSGEKSHSEVIPGQDFDYVFSKGDEPTPA